MSFSRNKVNCNKEREATMMGNGERMVEAILPLPVDDCNRVLINNVHPPDWINPTPAAKYDLAVIGAGTAGLVAAALGAALGARVALIERHLMGGDSLNAGCIPSKRLVRAARAWAEVRRGAEFGLEITDRVRCDFGAVMKRMRCLRAHISQTSSVHRYAKMGVDVFIGEGQFSGQDTITVDGKMLRFKKAAICTGARPVAAPIPGLAEAGYLTNETIFTLTELPPRLAVIGGGPIACELAQAFARFGSSVTLFERGTRILPREDADAARIVQKRMVQDGVTLVFESKVTHVEDQRQERIVHYEIGGEKKAMTVDQILVGIGRAPNVEGLGLETVGVEYDTRAGVKVNNRLQTTNPRIYAAGDVCFPFKLTNAADASARIVIQNALSLHPRGLGYASTDALVIPWCTYTDPEIAHVGMYEAEARAKGIAVDIFTHTLDEIDRAILDGEDDGFARLHVHHDTARIVGATIVAAHAGEMISEITLAMNAGVGLETISATIHPYPTQSEVIKKAASAWRMGAFHGPKKGDNGPLTNVYLKSFPLHEVNKNLERWEVLWV
jgi:pyruvate/2-oxoglutarate dehydrogenase complex dihydrolipoamide dehydrogenase (E3) component